MLYVYGGFGNVLDPFLQKPELLFLKHFKALYVFVGIRGGGEKGDKWHKAGIREKR